jgi:Tfp pilus assembly protein PilW
VLVFGLLVILMPLSMYAAQKWAYRTYQEVAKLNAQFETLLTLMRQREDR